MKFIIRTAIERTLDHSNTAIHVRCKKKMLTHSYFNIYHPQDMRYILKSGTYSYKAHIRGIRNATKEMAVNVYFRLGDHL